MRTKGKKHIEPTETNGVVFAVLKLIYNSRSDDGCIGYLPVYESIEEAEAAAYFGKFQIVAIQEVKES